VSLIDYPASKAALTERIYASLERLRSLRGNTAGERAEDRLALRVWQAARLARTHGDLLESARYGEAAAFFLSDLYGPKDYRRRDEEVARIVPTLATLLPVGAVQSLAMAIELDALSESLDAGVTQRLRAKQPDAAKPLAIDEASYAEVYRGASRDEREHQIELVDTIGKVLDSVAHKPFITTAMEFARMPARLAGLGEMHDFLARGLAAFRRMDGADPFLETIRRRESEIMRQIFAGAANPFAVSG